jgi:uncharacterized protein (DUF58 family)
MRFFRIAALFVPSFAAWAVVAGQPRHHAELLQAGREALLPLFLLMTAALAVRAIEAVHEKRSWLEALDVLTGFGRALACTSALMVCGAVSLGWASLAIVGMLGFAILHVMVTWTAIAAGGAETFASLSVTRRFSPSTAIEGDEVQEEILVSGARILPGFRLFLESRVPRHARARYVVGSEASSAEVSLTAVLGPAQRGEFEAPPVEIWQKDVFGICRSRIVRLGAARLTVLPRVKTVDDIATVAGARGDDADSVPTRALPTEGSFRLREYVPGDDARRIHWVRSLVARELVVRLPDEVPRQQPALRLVLDTGLLGAASLRTPAVHELCDALVRVWISVAQALASRGVRVTAVAAVGDRVVTRDVTPQGSGPLLRLGARVDWQGAVPLLTLVGGNARAIVVSARPRPVAGDVAFVVVPEFLWTEPRLETSTRSLMTLPFPTGAVENRRSRRVRSRWQAERERRAGTAFAELMQWSAGPHLDGALLARPRGARVRLETMEVG